MSTIAASTDAACDVCGWMAALGSMVAFGSFGVPIKSAAAIAVDIDPLVFQSYKTFLCLLTSWLVLLYRPHFHFTPWGIVSGLFWVPGGVAAVYGIKHAGLAVAIGIGSSMIVLVSFIWGIFIFHEPVHSRFTASFAIGCMMLGLYGMSYYSRPDPNHDMIHVVVSNDDDMHNNTSNNEPNRSILTYQGVVCQDDDDDNNNRESNLSRLDVATRLRRTNTDPSSGTLEINHNVDEGRNDEDENNNDDDAKGGANGIITALAPLGLDDDDDALTTHEPGAGGAGVAVLRDEHDETLVLLGYELTKRQQGMLAAMFNGVWGGSIMAPMKWSKTDDTKGIGYLTSFAIGASIVNVALWLLRYLYHVYLYQSPRVAYQSLPSFHIRVMWLPGGISGLLWSVGNFFSLISVYYLGEGVGYPLVQTAILVSGLWGIFYFKEVRGRERIVKWLCSSCLTIYGIVLLSYEHHQK